METTRQSEAALKLLKRREARRGLADWARICGYEPAKHHLYLISKLEAAVRGELKKKKVMVFMPPNSAKSTYSSVLFPPWYLAQRPEGAILTCSCTSDLAEYWGYRSRNLVQDHYNDLGYALREDSRASKLWMTNKGGLFFCGGVGSGIIGRRADLGLIDDPIGSMGQAYSKIERDKAWNWYNYDFTSRLNPGSTVVLIHQRWHEDDLAGRLLASERDEWEVVEFPMLAKDNDVLGRTKGELLWPEYYTEQMLHDAQKIPAKWSALYQQDPTPEDGDYFRRSWIEDNAYDRDELPDMSELSEYVGSDHAVSQKQDADSTCMIPAGVDSHNVLWVLPDIFWDKCDTGVMVDAMIAMIKRHALRTWWAESEQISKSIGPFLRQRMREQGVFCYIEEARPSRDKQTRAQSIRGRFQTGTIRLPRFAPWYNKAVEQMLKFPAGAHDDFIDALAHIGLGLDKMVRGTDTPPIVDPMFYFKDRPLTVQWLKGTEERQRMRKLVALRDN